MNTGYKDWQVSPDYFKAINYLYKSYISVPLVNTAFFWAEEENFKV
jgi:hypothetical protein